MCDPKIENCTIKAKTFREKYGSEFTVSMVGNSADYYSVTIGCKRWSVPFEVLLGMLVTFEHETVDCEAYFRAKYSMYLQ